MKVAFSSFLKKAGQWLNDDISEIISGLTPEERETIMELAQVSAPGPCYQADTQVHHYPGTENLKAKEAGMPSPKTNEKTFLYRHNFELAGRKLTKKEEIWLSESNTPHAMRIIHRRLISSNPGEGNPPSNLYKTARLVNIEKYMLDDNGYVKENFCFNIEKVDMTLEEFMGKES